MISAHQGVPMTPHVRSPERKRVATLLTIAQTQERRFLTNLRSATEGRQE